MQKMGLSFNPIEYFALPQLLEEIAGRHHLHIMEDARLHVQRDDNQAGRWMFFFKGLEASQMLGLYLLARFELNSNLGITQNSIHLISRVGMPIRQSIFYIVISQIGNDFLHQQMFKGVTKIIASWQHIVAV